CLVRRGGFGTGQATRPGYRGATWANPHRRALRDARANVSSQQAAGEVFHVVQTLVFPGHPILVPVPSAWPADVDRAGRAGTIHPPSWLYHNGGAAWPRSRSTTTTPASRKTSANSRPAAATSRRDSRCTTSARPSYARGSR